MRTAHRVARPSDSVAPRLWSCPAPSSWRRRLRPFTTSDLIELDGNAHDKRSRMIGTGLQGRHHRQRHDGLTWTSAPELARSLASNTAVAWANDGAPERDHLHRRRLEGPERPQPVGVEGRRRAAGQGQPAPQLRRPLLDPEPVDPRCRDQRSHTCEVLFFGSDRFDNSGDAQQGFWFFQNTITLGRPGGEAQFTGVHKAGDLLVISDFSNGGRRPRSRSTSGPEPTPRVASNLPAGRARVTPSRPPSSADTYCGIVNASNGTRAMAIHGQERQQHVPQWCVLQGRRQPE